MNGFDGADALFGGDGNDILNGGAGNDSMTGGAGNDAYIVDSTGDTINESAAAEIDKVVSFIDYTLGSNLEDLTLIGTAVNAVGNAATNSLVGNALNNTLSGLGGNDFLSGGLGNDLLLGGDGNDYLEGQGGDDQLEGGAGDDTYVITNSADVVVEAAAQGYDRVYSSADLVLGSTAEVEFVLLTGAALAATGSNTVNQLVGNASDNTLSGLGGNDYLSGGLGNDLLLGGDGNDYLEGQGGDDQLEGGAGDDIYIVTNSADVVVEAAAQGYDRVYSSADLVLGSTSEVEFVLLTGAALAATGSNTVNQLVGNASDNTLSGLGGNDYLSGGLGNDLLLGGDGNDYLEGQGGDDQLEGGAGDDTYVITNSADVVVEAAAQGYDRVYSSADLVLGSTAEVEFVLLTGAALAATGSNTVNQLVGNASDNTLSGLGGNDFLSGGLGNDLLLGGDGNDYLEGQGGDDRLEGGAGDDILIGATGADTLLGGAGLDRFIFGALNDFGVAGGAREIIADFVSGQDRIQFIGIDANAGVAGDQAFAMINTAAFSNVAGQLRYFTEGANTVMEGDVNGDGVADFQLQLTGIHTFVAAGTDLIYTIEGINNQPTPATAIAAQTATEDAAFSFAIPASAFADVDVGDTLAYSATLADGSALPAWLSFDGITFSGTPLNSDVTSIDVRVTATNIAGAFATSDFSLSVANTNDAPTPATAIAAQTATEDAAFSFAIPASAFADVDVGDTFAYSATLADGSALPAWLSFDGITFSGTPLNSDVTSIDVRVTATDIAGAFATSDFSLSVANTNDAPTPATAIAAQTATEDAAFSFAIPDGIFADMDVGDTLTYIATLADGSALPTWLSFDGTTFSGTPLNDDVGSINLRITATDIAGASITSDFSLSVANTNDTPTGSVTISDATPDLNQTLSASNTLGDVDGLGAISYQWQSLSTTSGLWSNIVGAINANFLTTPAQVGQQLRVTASYSDGAGMLESVTSDPTAAVGAFNVINGTTASETINGTTLRDHINGNGGNDVLNGFDGADALFGGDGNDILNGGAGNDSMTGGADNDAYIVDSTGDTINEGANAGKDRVISFIDYTLGGTLEDLTLMGSAINGVGNTGTNQLIGNALNNTLSGLGGNDYLSGGLGNDLLLGGDGNDYLEGQGGDDQLEGGAGDDTYVITNSADVVIEAAAQGYDRVYSSADLVLGSTAEVEFVLLTGAALAATGSNTVNQLVGNALDNTLSGLGGNDYLSGGLGNDLLLGGDGNDYLEGQGGDDQLEGGAGDDIYIVTNSADVVVEAAAQGYDRVYSSADLVLGSTAEVEFVLLTGAALAATGSNTVNQLIGNALDNTLSGLGGNDYLSGGLGNDLLLGGDGNDYLEGQGGDDQLEGGAGDDTYVITNSADVVVEAAAQGYDRVYSSADLVLGSTAEVEFVLLTGAALAATGSNTVNQLVGNASDNTLSGLGGNDYLSGGLGNDLLLGGDGNDYLEGQGGDDRLEGGAGDDILIGATGADTLLGGAGLDRFIFGTLNDFGVAGGAREIIADFVSGQDRIQFIGIDANAGVAGDQAFAMINTAAFSNVAGQLRYFTEGANTVMEGDVNGDGVADFQLQLTGIHTFVAADLLL